MSSFRRRRASIRRNHPLAFYLVAVLVGQSVGAWYALALTLVALPAFRVFRIGSELFTLLAPLWLGVFSASFYSALPPPGGSLLIRVTERPRYREAGEVQFVAQVLAQMGPVSSEHPERLHISPNQPRIHCRGVYLPWRNIRTVDVGAYLFISAKLEPIQNHPNFFSYDSSLLGKGVTARCSINYASVPIFEEAGFATRSRQKILERVHQVIRSPEMAGLMLSMSFGFRDQVSNETELIFKTTGLSHLLVLSGYQVGLIFISIGWVVRRVLALSKIVPMYLPLSYISTPVALSMTALFVAVVGAEGSSLRALFAVSAYSLGSLTERKYGITTGILFSALILLLLNPNSWRDPGLHLTYAALIGIGLGSGGSSPFWSFIRINLLCSLFTSIVSFLWFGKFYPLGFLLNPIFGPLLGVLSCKFGMAALLFQLIGVDPDGVMLRAVAEVLMICRDFLELLTT